PIANNKVTSVAGNGGNGGANGGGIWIQSGTAKITNSTIAGNQAVHPANTSSATGGGIGTQGELTLANVTLAGNSAGSFGGNLRAQTASQVTVKNTIVSGGATTASTGNENCYIAQTTPFAEDHN